MIKDADPKDIIKQQQQRQQTAQIIQANTGTGAYNSPQDRYGSAITTLTDPIADIEKFKLFLRSQAYDIDGQLVQIARPLMNEEGINAFMLIINSIVHQTGSMTNYSMQFLENLYDEIKADLITNLMTKRLQYEIDRKDRFLITGSSIRFIMSFALKSFEEGERKFWKGSSTEVTHREETNKSRGSLNPFGWGKK